MRRAAPTGAGTEQLALAWPWPSLSLAKLTRQHVLRRVLEARAPALLPPYTTVQIVLMSAVVRSAAPWPWPR